MPPPSSLVFSILFISASAQQTPQETASSALEGRLRALDRRNGIQIVTITSASPKIPTASVESLPAASKAPLRSRHHLTAMTSLEASKVDAGKAAGDSFKPNYWPALGCSSLRIVDGWLTVRQGDSVHSLARCMGLPMENLITWNNLPSAPLQPGQRIFVKSLPGEAFGKQQKHFPGAYSRVNQKEGSEFSCDPPCKECHFQQPQRCKSCHEGSEKRFLLNEMCYAQCPTSMYPMQALVAEQDRFNVWTCGPCDAQCLQCFADGPLDCSVCSPKARLTLWTYVNASTAPGMFQMQQRRTCLDSCPTHHFATAADECHECHASCKSCRGPADYECTDCTGTQVLHNGQCKPECPWDFVRKPWEGETNQTGKCFPRVTTQLVKSACKGTNRLQTLLPLAANVGDPLVLGDSGLVFGHGPKTTYYIEDLLADNTVLLSAPLAEGFFAGTRVGFPAMTRLAYEMKAGSDTIRVSEDVGWKVDDIIQISTKGMHLIARIAELALSTNKGRLRLNRKAPRAMPAGATVVYAGEAAATLTTDFAVDGGAVLLSRDVGFAVGDMLTVDSDVASYVAYVADMQSGQKLHMLPYVRRQQQQQQQSEKVSEATEVAEAAEAAAVLLQVSSGGSGLIIPSGARVALARTSELLAPPKGDTVTIAGAVEFPIGSLLRIGSDWSGMGWTVIARVMAVEGENVRLNKWVGGRAAAPPGVACQRWDDVGSPNCRCGVTNCCQGYVCAAAKETRAQRQCVPINWLAGGGYISCDSNFDKGTMVVGLGQPVTKLAKPLVERLGKAHLLSDMGAAIGDWLMLNRSAAHIYRVRNISADHRDVLLEPYNSKLYPAGTDVHVLPSTTLAAAALEGAITVSLQDTAQVRVLDVLLLGQGDSRYSARVQAINGTMVTLTRSTPESLPMGEPVLVLDSTATATSTRRASQQKEVSLVNDMGIVADDVVVVGTCQEGREAEWVGKVKALTGPGANKGKQLQIEPLMGYPALYDSGNAKGTRVALFAPRYGLGK